MGRRPGAGGLTVSPAATGILAALLTLALDQGSKLLLLFGSDLPVREPVELGPFVSLVVVWNRGISYGLFQQGTDLGRLVLIGVSCVACLALGIWMVKATNRVLAVSLGMIVGGAAGNAIDRAVYGAVFDFVHLHVSTYSWYVFNIADAAIVFGVVGLVYDAFVADRQRLRKV